MYVVNTSFLLCSAFTPIYLARKALYYHMEGAPKPLYLHWISLTIQDELSSFPCQCQVA